MKKSIIIISWLSRIIAMLFTAFISIFALDVFDEGYSFGKTIIALLMHLIPAFILLAILFASWRREWIGGYAFLLLSILYAITAWGKIGLSGFFMIETPLFILAILYFIVWFKKRTHLKNA